MNKSRSYFKLLEALHSCSISLFYGIGLPADPIILLDWNRGFLVEEREANRHCRIRVVHNAEDVYLRLVWHKFGIAVLLAGRVKETDVENKMFCVAVGGQREQWCRFSDAVPSGPSYNGEPG
jgi:hypothetical protein